MGNKFTEQDFEALAAEAKAVIERGSYPDALVLKAIGMGCGTRAEIKNALRHFDYAAIEKALERQGGEIRTSMKGMIERFTLVGSNGHAVAQAEIADMIERGKEPPVAITEADRRSAVKKGVSLDGKNKIPAKSGTVTIDYQKAENLRAEGQNFREIADALGVDYKTILEHKDLELDAALERGFKRLNASAQKTAKEFRESHRTEVSPVGYIEEVPESIKKAMPDTKFSARAPVEVRDEIAERLQVEPEIVGEAILKADAEVARAIDAAPGHPLERQRSSKFSFRYGEVLIECDTPAEAMALIDRLRPVMPKTVKRAWSREFENDDHEEGATGLTYLYLVSVLHDGMENHEKEAVWTLIQYLKRMQANAEMEKLSGKENH